jgi:hypothetical protein
MNSGYVKVWMFLISYVVKVASGCDRTITAVVFGMAGSHGDKDDDVVIPGFNAA